MSDPVTPNKPGWYRSTNDPTIENYWDGFRWTEQHRQLANPAEQQTSASQQPQSRQARPLEPVQAEQRGGATSNVLSILAIVSGVIAVLILPIIFGPIGIVLGIVAKVRHERLSTIAIIVAVVGMILGFALAALVVSQTT